MIEVKEVEAYENYLELQKLGVSILGDINDHRGFNGTAKDLKYKLDDKFKDSKVTLVPFYHSKRVIQDTSSLAMPQVERFQSIRILKKSVVDAMGGGVTQDFTKLMGLDNSFITLHKDEIEVDLYEVYDFLTSCWKSFQIQVKDNNWVYLIPRLVTSTQSTVEDVIKKTGQNLGAREKDALRNNLEVIEIGK